MFLCHLWCIGCGSHYSFRVTSINRVAGNWLQKYWSCLSLIPTFKFLSRPYTNLTEERIATINFQDIEIRGGGKLVIEGDHQGLNLVGSKIHVQSGGILQADHVRITADDVIIDESAILDATSQVILFYRIWPELHIFHTSRADLVISCWICWIFSIQFSSNLFCIWTALQ